MESIKCSPLSRMEFAQRLSQIVPGMSKREVEKSLGPPDSIHKVGRNAPPGNIPHYRTASVSYVWEYGKPRQNEFPSLGRVYMTKKKQVVDTVGQGQPHRLLSTLDEKNLQNLLEHLYQLCKWTYGATHNPLSFIKVANKLCHLNYELALQVILEYLRVGGEVVEYCQDQLALLIRILYDPRDITTPFPVPPLGLILPMPPADGQLLPRYPVWILDDVPFSLIACLDCSGPPYMLKFELSEILDLAAFHGRPLAPSPPIEIWRKLENHVEEIFGPWLKDEPEISTLVLRQHLFQQFLNLLSTVYRPQPRPTTGMIDRRLFDLEVENHLKQIESLPLHWNLKTSEYEIVGRPPSAKVKKNGLLARFLCYTTRREKKTR